MGQPKTEINEEERWADLNDWLTQSEAERAQLAKRQLLFTGRDLHEGEQRAAVRFEDALDAWEADRSLLVWACGHTPGTTLAALQVKARMAQACVSQSAGLGRFKKAHEIELRANPLAVDLAQDIVRELLAMQDPQPANAA